MGGARGRLLAVGDIHGCREELAVLLAALRPGEGDTVVFIGDYIDRGPDSRGVIEELMALRAGGGCRTVFLKGNHEDMFLAYLGFPGRYGDASLLNGAGATLRSYGLDERMPAREVVTALPPAHLEFLRGDLVMSFRAEGYLFVHAGVRPDLAWGEQSEEDLLWIREGFLLHPHRLGETVVFGHTPVREVLFDLPYKLGIDTGLVYGNKLSCLDLSGAVLYEVARGSRRARSRDVSERLRVG